MQMLDLGNQEKEGVIPQSPLHKPPSSPRRLDSSIRRSGCGSPTSASVGGTPRRIASSRVPHPSPRGHRGTSSSPRDSKNSTIRTLGTSSPPPQNNVVGVVDVIHHSLMLSPIDMYASISFVSDGEEDEDKQQPLTSRAEAAVKHRVLMAPTPDDEDEKVASPTTKLEYSPTTIRRGPTKSPSTTPAPILSPPLDEDGDVSKVGVVHKQAPPILVVDTKADSLPTSHILNRRRMSPSLAAVSAVMNVESRRLMPPPRSPSVESVNPDNRSASPIPRQQQHVHRHVSPPNSPMVSPQTNKDVVDMTPSPQPASNMPMVAKIPPLTPHNPVTTTTTTAAVSLPTKRAPSPPSKDVYNHPSLPSPPTTNVAPMGLQDVSLMSFPNDDTPAVAGIEDVASPAPLRPKDNVVVAAVDEEVQYRPTYRGGASRPLGNPSAIAGSPPSNWRDVNANPNTTSNNDGTPTIVDGHIIPEEGRVLVRCVPLEKDEQDHDVDPTATSCGDGWHEGCFELRQLIVVEVPGGGMYLCQSPATVVQCLEEIPMFLFSVSGLSISTDSQPSSRPPTTNPPSSSNEWCRLVLTFDCGDMSGVVRRSNSPDSNTQQHDSTNNNNHASPTPSWELLFRDSHQRSRWTWWLHNLCNRGSSVQRYRLHTTPPSWWGTVSDEDASPAPHRFFDELATCSQPAVLAHRIVPAYHLPLVLLNASRRRTLAAQPKLSEPNPHTTDHISLQEASNRSRVERAHTEALLECILAWFTAVPEEAEDGPCAALLEAVSTEAYSIVNHCCKTFAHEDQAQPLRKGISMRFTTCFCCFESGGVSGNSSLLDYQNNNNNGTDQQSPLINFSPTSKTPQQQRRNRTVSFHNAPLPTINSNGRVLPRTKSNLSMRRGSADTVATTPAAGRMRGHSTSSTGALSGTTTMYSQDRDISASDNVMLVENSQEESLALRAHVSVTLWCELAADKEYSFWDAQTAKELGKVASSTIYDVRSALLRRRTTVQTELDMMLTPMFSLFKEHGAFGRSWEEDQEGSGGGSDSVRNLSFGATMDGPGAINAMRELMIDSAGGAHPLPNGGTLSLYKPKRRLLEEFIGKTSGLAASAADNLKSLQKSARSRLASMHNPLRNPLQQAVKLDRATPKEEGGVDAESTGGSPPTSPHLSHHPSLGATTTPPPSVPDQQVSANASFTVDNRFTVRDELDAANIIKQLDLRYLITIVREGVPRHEPVEFTDKSVRDAAHKKMKDEEEYEEGIDTEPTADPTNEPTRIKGQKMKIYRVYGQIGLRLTFADASNPSVIDHLLYRVPRLIVSLRFTTAAECERFYHRIQLLSSRCMIAQLRDENHHLIPYWYDDKELEASLAEDDVGTVAQEAQDLSTSKRIQYSRPPIGAFVHAFIEGGKKIVEADELSKGEGSGAGSELPAKGHDEDRAMERVLTEYYTVLKQKTSLPWGDEDGAWESTATEDESNEEAAEKVVQKWLSQVSPPEPLTSLTKFPGKPPVTLPALVQLVEVYRSSAAPISVGPIIQDEDAIEDGTVVITKHDDGPTSSPKPKPNRYGKTEWGVRCVNLTNRVQITTSLPRTPKTPLSAVSGKSTHTLTRVIVFEDAKSRLMKQTPMVFPIDCFTVHVEDREWGQVFELIVDEDKALQRLSRMSQSNPDFETAIRWMKEAKQRVHHRRMASRDKRGVPTWQYARYEIAAASFAVRSQWLKWLERVQGPLSETFRERVEQRKQQDQIRRLEQCIETLDGLTTSVAQEFKTSVDVPEAPGPSSMVISRGVTRGVHPDLKAGALKGLRQSAPGWLVGEARNVVAHSATITYSALALVQASMPQLPQPTVLSPHEDVPIVLMSGGDGDVLLESGSDVSSNDIAAAAAPATNGRLVDAKATSYRSFLFHEYHKPTSNDSSALVPDTNMDNGGPSPIDFPQVWCALSGHGEGGRQGEASFGTLYLVAGLLSDGSGSPVMPSIPVTSEASAAAMTRWRNHFHALCVAEFCFAFGVREGVDTVVDVSSIVRVEVGASLEVVLKVEPPPPSTTTTLTVDPKSTPHPSTVGSVTRNPSTSNLQPPTPLSPPWTVVVTFLDVAAKSRFLLVLSKHIPLSDDTL